MTSSNQSTHAPMSEVAWRQTELGDILTLQRGFDLPSKERVPGPFPIVSSSGLTGFHIEYRVDGPGVVTGRYGTLGEVFYQPGQFWPLNTTLYVRDFKGNDPRYIFYLLQSLDFSAYSDKSSVPGLNRNHLHQIKVKVPPLLEQRTIAHILGTLDDKIELNRQMNQTLEEIAAALFRSWFIDFDPVRAKIAGRAPEGMDAATAALFPERLVESEMGEIPEGWEGKPLLEMARLLSGGTPKTDRPEYWDGPILWASAKDVSQCGDLFLIETERTITPLGVEKSATRVIPAFCTVVVARGATTGRMVLLGRDMAMNQTCYALQTTTQTPFTLHCLLQRKIDALVQRAHGSVFDTVTTSTFTSARAVLPPLRLLKKFEDVVGPPFLWILGATEQTRTLAALRDTLLRCLLSGELRVSAEMLEDLG